MKLKNILLGCFLSVPFLASDLAIAASGKSNEIQVILGGSGCPGKTEMSIPLDQNSVNQSIEVPVNFKSTLGTLKNQRLICQARLVFPNMKNKKIRFKSIQQVFSFDGKASKVLAGLSIGLVKGKDAKIEETLEIKQKYGQQLSKKLIEFESVCSKPEIVRVASELRLVSGSSLSVDVAPAALELEVVDCQ